MPASEEKGSVGYGRYAHKKEADENYLKKKIISITATILCGFPTTNSGRGGGEGAKLGHEREETPTP